MVRKAKTAPRKRQIHPDPDRAGDVFRNAIPTARDEGEPQLLGRPQFLIRPDGVHIFCVFRDSQNETVERRYVLFWHEAFGLLADLAHAQKRMIDGKAPLVRPAEQEVGHDA